MATKTLNVRLKQKSDTAANWTANNPVLLKGEIGLETDTLKFKFGDGTTTWTSLKYAGFSPEDQESIAASLDELSGKITTNTTNISQNTASINSHTSRLDGLDTTTTNLSNKFSDYYTKTEVDGYVAGAFHFKGEADSFENGEVIKNDNPILDKKAGDVYQVGDKEYAYNGTTWVELGFNIDLSGYATKTELNTKVDKNGTDRLMTTDEGTKLAGIEAGAQLNLIEKIKIANEQLTITDKTVTIPTATSTTLGVIKPGTEFAMGTNGELNINAVNVNKLEQTAGDSLILDCGASVQ